MGVYEIAAWLIVLASLPLFYFKRTNLFGTGFLALAFIVRAIGKAQSGESPVFEIFMAVAFVSGIVFQTIRKERSKT